jgi:hypothetical protein
VPFRAVAKWNGSVIIVSEWKACQDRLPFFDCPPDEIRRVWLDSHSAQVELIRILARESWHRDWEFLPGSEGFEDWVISGQDAAVCIGDKSSKLKKSTLTNWI